jgi:hypothetical protein
MSGYRIIEITSILMLGWFVLVLTLPFEQDYDETLRVYAREPGIRILLGLLLIAMSRYSIPVALLMFLIVFFLIADVHLVSTTK